MSTYLSLRGGKADVAIQSFVILSETKDLDSSLALRMTDRSPRPVGLAMTEVKQ